MSYGDSEDEFLEETLENYGGAMDHWRWCDHLSVVEASMLAVGLDPSIYEPSTASSLREGYFHKIGMSNNTRNFHHSVEFIPVFRATSYAAMKGELPCDFAHHARTIPTSEFGDRDLDGPPVADEESISYDMLIRSDIQVSSNFEVPPYGKMRKLYFVKEPDWERSVVKVDDFKDWMRDRGYQPIFFFPHNPEDSEAFCNPAHEHFSAELDLAIKAWRALLPKRKYTNGVKSAIETWIDENPKAWKGTEPISGAAKERISTLVNWNKGGGAPRTGG